MRSKETKFDKDFFICLMEKYVKSHRSMKSDKYYRIKDKNLGIEFKDFYEGNHLITIEPFEEYEVVVGKNCIKVKKEEIYSNIEKTMMYEDIKNVNIFKKHIKYLERYNAIK